MDDVLPEKAFMTCNGLTNRSVKIVLADNIVIVDFVTNSIAVNGCNVQIHGKHTSLNETIEATLRGDSDFVNERPKFRFGGE